MTVHHSSPSVPYRGRFAPSPTGPLHFGSLVAAVASYLDARHHGGAWLVRTEDLDPPREKSGAADDILRTLEALGLEWDEVVERQSRRHEAYGDIVADLLADGSAYPCSCSRQEIASAGIEGGEGPVYPGTCRSRHHPESSGLAIRVLTHARPIEFRDRIQAAWSQRVENAVGDFVIRRADGYFAYQLAVVVDDAWQRITHVVRGADLLSSTPRQLHLQRMLGLAQPLYAHLPLVVDSAGNKLSKSDAAHPVDRKHPLPALRQALQLLEQPIPPADNPRDLLAAAAADWDIARIPARHVFRSDFGTKETYPQR